MTILETKLFKIENIIFDQVFVQTIIHYVLEYFGKAWEHRYWSIVTYKIVVTVITLINRLMKKLTEV